MATALLILAGAGVVLTTVQILLVARLRRKSRPFARRGPGSGTDSRPAASTEAPRVSILKPLSDLDDDLAENLASFARLRGVSYEVILAAGRPDDPAVHVAREVMRRFPSAPFRLVIGGPSRRAMTNRKVERLVTARRLAAGEILFVSDSNVRVSPDDVASTVALFDDPAVGCVSNLFVGEGARSFGASVDSLHLLTFVLPGTALAAASGVPCVVGKSMALSRRALTAIGGFEAFLDVLAEDQAIGVAVRSAGFSVAVSPVVVKNVVVSRPLRAALARQARWNKIRWSFSKSLYAGEFLLNPLPVSLLACAAATLAAPELLPSFAVAAGLLSFVRFAQTAALARLTGARLPLAHLLALPLKDLLQFGAQFAPLFSREVRWHDTRARLGPGTVLLPSRREAALAA
ncbi:MAG TPA: glycosyltransferase [Thermoanaerobaculia bacterium]|nr:glycosyltransferase [Thermoanaerobaculia bacterium]